MNSVTGLGSGLMGGPTSDFERETLSTAGDGSRLLVTSPHWRIGENENGGYVTAIVARAMSEAGAHPDPLSVTTHFLRPVAGDAEAAIETELVRTGRTLTTWRGRLSHGGKQRVEVLAAFGDLSERSGTEWEPAAPDIAAPDDCLHRSGLEQGIDLPILARTDVRIDPTNAVAGTADQAVVNGWIRFTDGADPDPLALLVFADAFPPSTFPRRGFSGWVPTIELTVHVRKRPAPGWIQARFECDDLSDGRLVESGTLWDSTGAVVARSRQLGLLLE